MSNLDVTFQSSLKVMKGRVPYITPEACLKANLHIGIEESSLGSSLLSLGGFHNLLIISFMEI